MTRANEFLANLKQTYINEIEGYKQQQQLGLYPSEFSFPVGVQFELTAKCNMNCKHCYNYSSRSRESLMTTEDWLEVVDDIIAHGGIFQCIISGGEPLMMGNDLFKIMQPLHDDGTGFVLITNGYLVNQEMVNKLKQYNYYWVQVSLDHLIPEKHDEFREKKGSWKKAVDACLMFSAAGLPLRIAHSLNPSNIDDLPQFAELAYKLGASTLVCGEIFLSGRVIEHQNLLMNDESRDRMYQVICQLQHEYKNKMAILPSANEKLDMWRHQNIPNNACIIRPDGSVRLDCTMPFNMGNIFDEAFSSIWKKQGAICWKSPQVEQFIQNYTEGDCSADIINHVTPDIALK